ncbi:MAG: hypothetical protein CHACPFDD_03815 [Phycisphaerae bacterium]|nr:hypothetical protein [Phycisphaerae bacterium]
MPGILCEHCTALCCRYIALPVDTPTTREELDQIRWFLLHGGVSIFIEDGDWYISMETACRHLQGDFRCGIYETRPKICRDFSTENCDYHAGDYGFEHHFTCPEHLEAYIRDYWEPAQAQRRSRRSGTRRPHETGQGSPGGTPRARGASRSKALRVSLKTRARGRRRGAAAQPSLTHDSRGVALPVLAFGNAE